MPWRDRFRRRRQAKEWREQQRRDLDDRLSATLPPAEESHAGAVAPPDADDTAEVGDDVPRPTVTRERPHVPVRLGAVSDEDYARAVRRAVSRALAEDLGHRGDVTSMATVPVGARGRAALVAREPGVVAGLDVVGEVVRQVDDRIEVTLLVEDGARIDTGDVVARLEGPLRTLLTAERTVLNLVCQLSGVATLTAAFAAALAGTDCVVRDTRKTTPGLRLLEKRAVAAGSGANHRVGLFDAILVKDNHVAAAGGVAAAARAALDNAPEGVHVQVEVTTLDEAEEAIAEGVEDLLLDNFTPDRLREAVVAIGGRAAVEASGGITLETVGAYAAAGADRLAVGALTHSAPALDLALDVEEVEQVAEPPEVETTDPVDEAADGDDAAATTGDDTASRRDEAHEGYEGYEGYEGIVVDRAPYDDGPEDDQRWDGRPSDAGLDTAPGARADGER